MATWKDGAAYAPVERPDGFATPVAEPLPAGEPYRAATPGPMHHPSGFAPMPPQQPLNQLGQTQTRGRNPQEAFAVASSLVTVGPDAPLTGARDPRTPFPTTAQSALDTTPPPTGQPLALPPPGSPAGAPPPPVPARAAQPGPIPEGHVRLAQVAAVLCLVGFFVTGTAPFMLTVAGVIGLITKRLTKALGHMALGSGAAGVLLSLVMDSWRFAPYAVVWGLIAMVCSIGFFIYSSQARANS